MALKLLLASLFVMIGAALAEPAAEPEVAAMTPPEVLELPEIAWPANAPTTSGAVDVVVKIRIDVDGTIGDAQLETGAGEPFDSAVLEGVRRFRFKPATYGGQPTQVLVPYTHTFLPPAPVAAPGTGVDEQLDAVLEGLVQERGTRTPLAGAVVTARDAGGERLATTDAEGKFTLRLRSGESVLRVSSITHRKFLQRERLEAGQSVKVRYLLDRQSYDPYESVVVGTRERTEISRTSLQGREITRIPGTFGDPFRVIAVLPGVTTAMSLLPLPIVRGSSPGNTGFFIDQVKLPLLFHLFGGPAVIHPEFIDRVDFYPGGFPVQFGGFTGGIVDGVTRRARVDESRFDLDLNLAQTGVFVRKGFADWGITTTAAGRIGYPGVLLSLITPDVSLDYWDYQLRLDGGAPDRAWSLFFFGAKDDLKVRNDPAAPLTTALRFQFHRVDLRYRLGDDERNATYRLVLGFDESRVGGEDTGTTSWVANPTARWELKLAPTFRLRAGADASVRTSRTDTSAELVPSDVDVAPLTDDGLLSIGGLFAEGLWAPRADLLVIPGVRADLYHQNTTTKWNVDPRIMARWKLSDDPVGGTTLKGVVGWYHQPPRLFMPIPGADQSALRLGLLGSVQVSVGAEVKLAPGVEVDVQTYYNHMNPVLFDLAINQEDVQQQGPGSLPGELPASEADDGTDAALNRLFKGRLGRSFGLEVLLRKRDTQGFFGWISYTLSRSERENDQGFASFDFDRTHILNLVAGLHLPRNWEIGGRVLLQSGTPITTLHGYNVGRSGSQLRVDLRIDKRAVWNKWLLDFYVDIINSTVAEEAGGLLGSESLRYLLPTVGFRAVL